MWIIDFFYSDYVDFSFFRGIDGVVILWDLYIVSVDSWEGLFNNCGVLVECSFFSVIIRRN